ncbi:MAG: fused MFS/spermidine synthase [Burkholderiales bacterium]|nr:fused MFS/spermidine synthase [Burkholderiales bacterium]
MILYAATILVSSFLLFLVQPIIAKQILPWFGGSAAVWTTCLVFFQLALLAGYAYSDVSSRLKPRTQSTLHIALLVASLASLPILAGAGWKPTGSEDPILRILGLLAATIGLPYFMLSTTGPLVQSWFAREHTDPATARRVYRFFALSNFGSLVGLLAYPFAIEMWVSTQVQAWGWSAAYALFVALCAASAWRARRGAAAPDAAPAGAAAAVPDAASANAAAGAPADVRADPPPGARDYALWFALAALASMLLLAISTHITQNVASVPFLWVLPLTLYLLTFVLCFEGRGGRGWYVRSLWLGPTLVILGLMSWGLIAERGVLRIDYAVPLYCAGLFLACMFCHGELAHAKPAPRYLTRFYLMLSVGGAAGGMFVGLAAPRLFDIYWELPLGLAACALMALVVTRRLFAAPVTAFAPLAAIVATGVCAYYANAYGKFMKEDTIRVSRNFYGALRVKQALPDENPNAIRRLMHGVIMHGEQYVGRDRRGVITSYYGDSSGVGMAIERIHPDGQRVGVIGLGAGTLAAYGGKGDVFRLYEINPQVIDIASHYFYYLAESGAKVETALGDARLVLEREAPQKFDVLAVDAFSSDAIPVHLITREALAVYLRHIKPDGAVAFHVTNRYLQLAPVVKLLADEVGMEAVLITDDPDDADLSRTDWVIVTRNRAFLDDPEVKKKRAAIEPLPGLKPWSDDFNNLFSVLKPVSWGEDLRRLFRLDD